MKALFLLSLILSLPTLVAAEQQPPSGWRFPQESDFTGDWKEFRDRLPTPFHVKADFNGDGITDDAWILIHTDNRGWGLFVFLGRQSGGAKVIQVDYGPKDSKPQSMGIGLAAKGNHQTACGKGYWACSRGEPKALRLNNAGIEYFMFESASSIFYWDRTSNRFKRAWISD